MALGTPWVVNPEAMLAEMPARIWKRWQQVFAVFPFGPQQDDLRAAHLCSLLFNVNRAGETEALEPADFFPSLPKSSGERRCLEDNPRYQELMARAFAQRVAAQEARMPTVTAEVAEGIEPKPPQCE